MKNLTVFVASTPFGFLRISCLTVLLFALSACGSSGGGDSDSGSGGSGSGSGATQQIEFLAVNDGVNGVELWKTDGTEAGTVLVKDINTTAGAGSLPHGFTEFNGAFYFEADDGVHGREIWKTDGTEGGTVLVKDINTTAGAGSNFGIYKFTIFNGALYFRADDGVNGYELWKTDGTAAGTVLVKDINTTAAGASSYPAGFAVFNGVLYFQANDGVNGIELWAADGTTAGTVLVKNINTLAGAEFWASSSPAGFSEYNGALYFQADDGVNGYELWKTDGTASGTVLVKDINTTAAGASSSPNRFSEYNGALYFNAKDGNGYGFELWKTDGTAAGTVLVKKIVDTALGVGSFPQSLTVFNGVLYFENYDSVNGLELWKTDGTEAGTVPVKVFNAPIPPGSTLMFSLTEFNGALYFQAYDGVDGHGFELWKTDGTEAGTVLVKDINTVTPGASSNPNSFTTLNGALHFYADDGVNGIELWKTDGTEAGTQLLKDICAGGCNGQY